MAIVNRLSIMTLNINGLNSIKGHRMAEWIKKEDPTTIYLQDTPFRFKDIHRLN